MDLEPDAEPARHRCQCGTLATIKTVFNRDGVVYHCGDLCRQHWMRTNKSVLVVNSTERQPVGWTK